MIIHPYDITQDFTAACQLLGQSSADILHKSGLPTCFLETKLVVTAKQLGAIFEALVISYGHNDWNIKLANGFADGAFGNAFLAMQCSANIREGVHRATRFKELLEPVKWTVTETDTALTVQVHSQSEDFPIGGMVQIMNFLWLVLTCRKITAKYLSPVQVMLTDPVPYQEEIERQLGCAIVIGSVAKLSFPIHVADTPILSSNRYVASGFDSNAALIDPVSNAGTQFANAVRLQILELLPSGSVSSARVAERLALSKRTLERRLSEEGMSFADILRDTRQQMADHYLRNTQISIEEVTYLIGYREVNSFYRACKTWYGATPQEIRNTSGAVEKQTRQTLSLNRAGDEADSMTLTPIGRDSSNRGSVSASRIDANGAGNSSGRQVDTQPD